MPYFKIITLAMGFLLSPFIYADNNQDAMNNPARTDDLKSRDAGRRPAKIMNFVGIKQGMVVLDYAASSGYYTEILSYAVGDKGKVYAQNRPGKRYESRTKAKIEPLLERLPNAEGLVVAGPEMDLPENSIDAAFIVLIFHHMHFNKENPDLLPENTRKTLTNIHRSLKPGGHLIIIEHAANKGTSRAESAALHRIEAETTIADITALGFTLAATSDLLHNKTDDRSKHFRQGGKRDTSWRLVHKYRKN